VAIGGSGHGSRDGLGDDALNVHFHPFRDLRRRRAIKSALRLAAFPPLRLVAVPRQHFATAERFADRRPFFRCLPETI
jgi:hypothetical protein